MYLYSILIHLEYDYNGREKLNRKFFAATQEIDDRKAKDFHLQKKLNTMPKWQREDHIKKNPESLGKHKQLIHKLKTEERALHEAYQILLSEHHIKKKLRKRFIRLIFHTNFTTFYKILRVLILHHKMFNFKGKRN